MTEPSLTDRPLRADAERNRLKILAAAAELFADQGFAASLDDVAAHAGVGVGTVYRRFPDKDALIDALFETRLNEIAELGRHALAAGDPWDGLVAFFTEAMALQAPNRGLRQAALSARGGDRARRARDRIAPISRELVARAQRAGVLRADLAATDMPLINMTVSAIADFTRDVSPEAYGRILQIILDGLVVSRSQPTPMPVGPMAEQELVAAITAHGSP